VLKTMKILAFLGCLLSSLGVLAASDYIQGHVGALSNQVSQEVGNVPGNRYNSDFEFDFNRSKPQRYNDIQSRFHVAGMVNDQNLTMYSLQEAYVGFNPTAGDHFRVGRQILNWSAVDDIWGFGKLNNRRNFNFLEPGQEGLVGLLYESRSKSGLRLRGFVSGLYLPEGNPPLDIDNKNGTITSRHPYANPPASRADVRGAMMDVKYNVATPKISDVIFRYTVGANAGWESKHWVVDNFIIRKPENSLTPNVQVNVSFADGIVNAAIDPRIYYHDVFGSTIKYRNRDVEVHFSGIGIRPNEYPVVDSQIIYTEIKSKKRREDYVGGGISRSNDLYTAAINYVARLSPFDRLKDDLSPDPRWNQAVNILLSRNFAQKYALSADLKYDMLTTDRLVMLKAQYKMGRDFLMNVGVNMIGTPTNGRSFWSPYTNNDAVYGGVRYVF
jgi:hypothetical protein